MKKVLFIQLMTVLIFSGCSNKQKNVPDIVYNGSAFIKLTIKNYSDTTTFYYKTSPILPSGCVIKEEEITHNGDYFFSYHTTMPDYLQFSIIQDFQTYLIPNDTLKIVANLDPSIDKGKAVTIDGIYGNISNYYAAKCKSLGYMDVKVPLSNYSSPSLTLDRAFALSDSLFQLENDFLINYRKNHDLPDWFSNIIEMDIDYFKIQIRPYLIDYRKYLLHENIKNSEVYYTSEIPVYNPDAKLSKKYYDYLDIYFGLKYEEDLVGKHGLERMVPLFERSIPDAQKELKGVILEYYLASRLSNLILSCRQQKELEKIDSVVNAAKPMFSNNEIIKMLESEKEKIAEFIDLATKNNPFSLIPIIANKK